MLSARKVKNMRPREQVTAGGGGLPAQASSPLTHQALAELNGSRDSATGWVEPALLPPEWALGGQVRLGSQVPPLSAVGRSLPQQPPSARDSFPFLSLPSGAEAPQDPTPSACGAELCSGCGTSPPASGHKLADWWLAPGQGPASPWQLLFDLDKWLPPPAASVIR